MNLSILFKRYLTVSVILGVLLSVTFAFAEDSLEDIQQRIQVLQQEAAGTTDINRLMEIASELTMLAGKIQPGLPVTSPRRGKTPDEEVNRDIQAINSSYERQKRVIAGFRDPNAPLVPFLSARKLHGRIEVRGSNQRFPSETPYNGGVSLTLQYTIKEDYVGYLITREYYDPKTGKFTDKIDYSIKTISKKVHAPAFGGKECIETLGNNWKACKKWEQYGLYRIAPENEYPAVHDWVIGGSPEGDGIMIQVETPDIIFSTVKNNEARKPGCFGAEIYLPNEDFAMDIEDNKLTAQKTVGGEFGATPHCGRGSTVALNFEICKEVPRCEQLESLLDKVVWTVNLRDNYGAMSKVASSEAELHTMVNLDLNDRYPNLDIQDEKFLKENAGGYNIHNGEIVLPNLCKGCATRPLCVWDREGLRIHEKTHELDVLANPELKRLYTDTLYQMQNFTANGLAREQARVRGEMEYHAYDEYARYLMDILQLELSQSAGCNFDPGFYVDLNRMLNALK